MRCKMQSNSSLISAGENEIRYKMIVRLTKSTKLFPLDTLNGLLTSHTSPETWKMSVKIPSYKPGKNLELPQSFRPIALTSCVCKLFERIVNNRLTRYLESKNLSLKRQSGLRKRQSTLDPVNDFKRNPEILRKAKPNHLNFLCPREGMQHDME